MALQASCKEEPREETPASPAFKLGSAVADLAPMRFDDPYFDTLDSLKQRAATPGSDPGLVEASIRFEMAAIAAGLASNHPASARVLGDDTGDVANIGKYLSGAANRFMAVRMTDDSRMLAATASSFAVGKSMDLSPVFVYAMQENAISPAMRLIVAHRLLEVAEEAAGAPDAERGDLVISLLPGFPSPPTQDLESTVFPAALRMIALLLDKGPGAEVGLAPHFKALLNKVDDAMGEGVFSLAVSLDPIPRIGTPVAGISVGYVPLDVFVLKKDALYLGARPSFVWSEGRPENATEKIGWPGSPVLSVDELHDLQDSGIAGLKEALNESAELTWPLEQRAYRSVFGADTPVLNVDRTERGTTALMAAQGEMEAKVLGEAMAAVIGAGVSDIRLIQPGTAGLVLPVFFRGLPDLPDVKIEQGSRALLVVSAEGVDLYPPDRKSARKLPMRGWPNGTHVEEDMKRFFKLTVPWNEERGYEGALTEALAVVADKTGCSPVVDVVVEPLKEVTSVMLVDAVAEIEAVKHEPFEAMSDCFPGLSCPDGSACPSMFPVLFSSSRVPRPSKTKPELKVKETRPAGFCDKAAVARVMRGRSGAYRACYEMNLQRHPDLAGRISIRFTIEPDGSVSGVSVTKNELTRKVSSCVVRQVSSLRFPKPDGGICVIRWPFKFQPGG